MEITTAIAIVIILSLGYYFSTRSKGDNELTGVSDPKHATQKKVSLSHFKHLNTSLLYKIWITEKKIDLLNPPQKYSVVDSDSTIRYLTADKKFYDANKAYRQDLEGHIHGYKRDTHAGTMGKVTLVSQPELIKAIKSDLSDLEADLVKHEMQHSGRLEAFGDHSPEPIEVIRDKYGLDKSFSADIDDTYVGTTATSHWGVYEERKAELAGLERALLSLQSRATRSSQ